MLSPDIVVTQGGPAKDAILKSFVIQQHYVEAIEAGSLQERGSLRSRIYRTWAGGEDEPLASYLPPRQLWTFQSATALLLAPIRGSGRSILAFARHVKGYRDY